LHIALISKTAYNIIYTLYLYIVIIHGVRVMKISVAENAKMKLLKDSNSNYRIVIKGFG